MFLCRLNPTESNKIKHFYRLYKNVHCTFYRLKSNFVDDVLLPAHKPETVERGKYEEWMKKEAFKASVDGPKENVFSIILPPPNVTGSLHLGHALTATVQDVLARYMRSHKTVLWLPGTDHAGIATQVAVEKYIQKKLGVTRQELGRDRFIEEVWKWRKKYGTQILQQLKAMGCSLDWSREMFTMDDRYAKAVKTAFIRLFDDGLIFRSEQLINWCCHLQTTISDIEVNKIPVNGVTLLSVPGYDEPVVFGLLYYFLYKLADGSGELTVATTRPETILGDVALAVNPSDDRHSKYIGRTVINPLTGAELPIVYDESVDPNFGSGVLKLTPAHDNNDFRIANKFGIKLKRVISEDGTICDGYGEFSCMKRLHARGAVLQVLRDKQLIVQEVPLESSIPVCSRSGDIIELMPKLQWFLSCQEMAKDAQLAVENGNIDIKPESYKLDWNNWLSSNRDWCISRQLWWGHRIPAYYCTTEQNTSGIWVAAENVEHASKKAALQLGVPSSTILCQQDDDVLDTWFSSGIYPFTSLGWPDNIPDFNHFYPLSYMITGNDILLFWVYRMVILGKKLTGQYPFTKIFLHGVICDDKGAKMSKSKGNVIDPEDVAKGASLKNLQDRLKVYKNDGVLSESNYEKALLHLKQEYPNGFSACGHDALRFTLCNRNLKSKYINFNPDECRTNFLFCNKIWNCTKFTRHSVNTLMDLGPVILRPTLNIFDRWILNRLANLTRVVAHSVESLDLHIATDILRDFLYRDLCDLYLETTKPAIWAIREKATVTQSDISEALGHCQTLSTCLEVSLNYLHPFMPFLTEELLPKIPHIQDGNIIFKQFDPQSVAKPYQLDFTVHKDLDQNVEQLKKLIEAVRHLKSLAQSPDKPSVIVVTMNEALIENVTKYAKILKFICGISQLTTDTSSLSDPLSSVFQKVLSEDCTVYVVRLNKSLNEEELELLAIKEQRLAKKLIALENRMASPEYRAPADSQNEHSEKLLSWSEELKSIRKVLEQHRDLPPDSRHRFKINKTV